jgi:hypothetical protein
MDHVLGGLSEDTILRIQGEFLEMPGLRLTEDQARKLWTLDAHDCAAVLAALTESGFLFRTRDGAFMRVERATPLKAALAADNQVRCTEPGATPSGTRTPSSTSSMSRRSSTPTGTESATSRD